MRNINGVRLIVVTMLMQITVDMGVTSKFPLSICEESRDDKFIQVSLLHHVSMLCHMCA